MTSPWEPGVNGAGKRPWFLIRRDETIPVPLRYYFDKRGYLVKYTSYNNAMRAADKLNHAEREALDRAIAELDRKLGSENWTRHPQLGN